MTVRLPAGLHEQLRDLVRLRRVEDADASAASVVRELILREAAAHSVVTCGAERGAAGGELTTSMSAGDEKRDYTVEELAEAFG